MDKDKNFIDDEALDEEYPIITMTDDETGEEVEFVVMDGVEVDGNNYFLVIESKEIDNDNAEALLLKEDKTVKGKDAIYSIVENDVEFESIIQLLNESSDEYDIEF